MGRMRVDRGTMARVRRQQALERLGANPLQRVGGVPAVGRGRYAVTDIAGGTPGIYEHVYASTEGTYTPAAAFPQAEELNFPIPAAIEADVKGKTITKIQAVLMLSIAVIPVGYTEASLRRAILQNSTLSMFAGQQLKHQMLLDNCAISEYRSNNGFGLSITPPAGNFASYKFQAELNVPYDDTADYTIDLSLVLSFEDPAE